MLPVFRLLLQHESEIDRYQRDNAALRERLMEAESQLAAEANKTAIRASRDQNLREEFKRTASLLDERERSVEKKYEAAVARQKDLVREKRELRKQKEQLEQKVKPCCHRTLHTDHVVVLHTVLVPKV